MPGKDNFGYFVLLKWANPGLLLFIYVFSNKQYKLDNKSM